MTVLSRRQSHRNNSGLATWLKVLIGVAGLGVVGGIVLAVVGGMYIFDLSRNMMDPQHVRRVSDSIAKIEYPLPSEFKPVMALDLMGVRTVSFSDMNEHLTIMLMQLEKAPKAASAEQVIQSYARKGSTMPGAKAGPGSFASAYSMHIQSTGHMTVGGESMPYAIGESEQNRVKLFQLIGCIMPKQRDRPILIIGQSFQCNEYKMELTKQFLARIKEF
jgi:hypothetical protein